LISGTQFSGREGRGHLGPALFLHCGLASHKAWSGVLRALGPDLAFVAPDLPGHGAVPMDMARDGLEQSSALALQAVERYRVPVHVIGHSFGAVTALRMAMDAPERVASLTLYEPVIFAVLEDADHPAMAEEVAKNRRMYAVWEAQGMDAAIDLFMSRWGGPGGSAGLDAEQRAKIAARFPTIRHTNINLFGTPPTRPSLSDISQLPHPMTLIAGEETEPVIHAILDVIAASRPVPSPRHTISAAGHMGPITHPDQIAAIVRSVLSSAAP